MSEKKLKGATLIEVIITLSICIILFGLVINNYKIYRKYINTINIDFSNNYILRIISNSALYCKKSDKGGYLLFPSDNEVKFYCDNKKIREYRLPDGFKFTNADGFQRRIRINNLGKVIKACTINYKDKENKDHVITIRVGTRYAKVK